MIRIARSWIARMLINVAETNVKVGVFLATDMPFVLQS